MPSGNSEVIRVQVDLIDVVVVVVVAFDWPTQVSVLNSQA